MRKGVLQEKLFGKKSSSLNIEKSLKRKTDTTTQSSHSFSARFINFSQGQK